MENAIIIIGGDLSGSAIHGPAHRLRNENKRRDIRGTYYRYCNQRSIYIEIWTLMDKLGNKTSTTEFRCVIEMIT